jgi:hypothetical protein
VTEIVDTYLGPTVLADQVYWHLVSPKQSMFFNNVRVGKGAVGSVSAYIAANPELALAQTAYSMSRINDDKEKIFDDVRCAINPALPPRLKSFYVFDDRALADRAVAEWFASETKQIFECRVVRGSITHRVDTLWLNAQPAQWKANAEKYWRGEMTSVPFPEVLVQGTLYFPDWKSFPWGV